MLFDLDRPAFQGSVTRPRQLGIAMNPRAGRVILCRRVSQQTDIKKIGRLGQKLERSEILFVQIADVTPDPANLKLFEATDDARQAPVAVAKFDGISKVAWQLAHEAQESDIVVFRRKKWGKLDQNAP